MRNIRKDYSGKIFGSLTVVENIGFNNRGESIWKCLCVCGGEYRSAMYPLINGNTKSCGCLRIKKSKELNTTHGYKGTRIYCAWTNMKQRCTNPKHPAYKHYGARGITVCERWLKFENFLEDMGTSELTLDRIDNNGNYCKENCRWATYKVQMNNTRKIRYATINGINDTVNNWASKFSIKKCTLNYRLYTKKMSNQEALNIL